MQEGGGIETSVNPRDVDDVAARKQWGIYYAEAIGPNGKRKEREPEASYFDLLSRFLLEVGDYLWWFGEWPWLRRDLDSASRICWLLSEE